MGNNDQDFFGTSIHCLGVGLSLISSGKVELWSEGHPLPNELEMIRKTYMKSLQGSHPTTWPAYLFVSRLAYHSTTEFWVKWLHNASRDLDTPSTMWLHHAIFMPQKFQPLHRKQIVCMQAYSNVSLTYQQISNPQNAKESRKPSRSLGSVIHQIFATTL